MTRFGVFLVATVGLASWAMTSVQSQTSAVVSLVTKQSVVLGEPVILRFLVVNYLLEPATFDLGYDRTGAFSIRVTPPNAEPVAVVTNKSLNPAGGISRPPQTTVDRYSEYRQAILLSERFQFVSPGVHRIEVDLATEFVWPNHRQPYRGVFTFDLTIGERDPRVLESVASDLAARLLSTVNAQERIETATALTFVMDPVAIPAIRRVLAASRFNDSLLIPGLRRIDSEETRQLLRELAATPSDPSVAPMPFLERGPLARRILESLEQADRR